MAKRSDPKGKYAMRKKQLPVLEKSTEAKLHYQKAAASKMILADAEWKWGWDALILLTTLYYGLSVPRVWYWQVDDIFPTVVYLVFECVATVLLAVDIYFNFWTAFVDKHCRLVEDSRQIAFNYLTTWFVVDFLSTVPMDLITLAFGKSTLWRVLYHFRLLRLLRLPTLWGMTARGNISGTYVFFHYHLIPNVRLFAYGVMAVHMCTMVWLVLQAGETNASQQAGDDEYVTALYFIVYTVASVGFGDIWVEGTAQMAFCIVLFAVSITVNGYIVGSLASSAQRYDVKREMKDKMRETLSVVEHYNIPQDLQQEVLAFQLHLLTHRVAASYTEVIGNLPKAMKKRLGLYIRVKFVSEVYLFTTASPEALLALAQKLKSMVVEPEEYIIRAGDPGKEMFFLGHGFCDVISADGNFLATIKKGTYFGEIALLLESNRTASIKALTYCDIFRLDKKDFLEIMNKYPEIKERVEEEIDKRKKEMEGKDVEERKKRESAASRASNGSNSSRGSNSSGGSRRGVIRVSSSSNLKQYITKPNNGNNNDSGGSSGSSPTISLLGATPKAIENTVNQTFTIPPIIPPTTTTTTTSSSSNHNDHHNSGESSSSSLPPCPNPPPKRSTQKRAAFLTPPHEPRGTSASTSSSMSREELEDMHVMASFSFGQNNGNMDVVDDDDTNVADLEEMDIDIITDSKKKSPLRRRKSCVVPLSFRDDMDAVSEINDKNADGDSMQPPTEPIHHNHKAEKEVVVVEDVVDLDDGWDSQSETGHTELHQLIATAYDPKVVHDTEYRLQKVESLMFDLSSLVSTIEKNMMARLGEIDNNVKEAFAEEDPMQQ